MDVNTVNNNLLIAIETVERQYRTHSRKKWRKISPEIEKLMDRSSELKNKNDINFGILR